MRSVCVMLCFSPLGRMVQAGPRHTPSIAEKAAIASFWAAMSVAESGRPWANADEAVPATSARSANAARRDLIICVLLEMRAELTRRGREALASCPSASRRALIDTNGSLNGPAQGNCRTSGSASADAALGRAFAEIAPNAPFVIYQFRIQRGRHFPVSNRLLRLPGSLRRQARRGRGEWRPAFSRVHPDDQKKLLDGILEVHRTLAPWHGEFRVRSPHGEVWVEGRSSGRREPDGSTLWFGVLFDITARKRIEEALREREEQLRAMFDVAPVGVAQADPTTGRWVAVNPRMCAITGYSETELLDHAGPRDHPSRGSGARLGSLPERREGRGARVPDREALRPQGRLGRVGQREHGRSPRQGWTSHADPRPDRGHHRARERRGSATGERAEVPRHVRRRARGRRAG